MNPPAGRKPVTLRLQAGETGGMALAFNYATTLPGCKGK